MGFRWKGISNLRSSSTYSIVDPYLRSPIAFTLWGVTGCRSQLFTKPRTAGPTINHAASWPWRQTTTTKRAFGFDGLWFYCVERTVSQTQQATRTTALVIKSYVGSGKWGHFVFVLLLRSRSCYVQKLSTVSSKKTWFIWQFKCIAIVAQLDPFRYRFCECK